MEPIIRPIAVQQTFHGKVIVDEYSWLRDENWPEISNQKILQYIDSENHYSDQFLKTHQNLIEKVFQEIKEKIPVQDFTVPYKNGNYLYYSYILENQQYWNHVRVYIENDEQSLMNEICVNNKFLGKVILNENYLSKDSKFFNISEFSMSPDHKMIAYAVDYKGNQRYDIIVQNAETGELIDKSVINTMGSIVWHANSNGFFYIPANEFWRAEKVIFHEINGKDTEIFHEQDYTFHVNIRKSNSERFLFIESASYTETETLYVDLQRNALEYQTIFPRKSNNIYEVEHANDAFYILTNDHGNNLRLIKASIGNLGEIVELIPHDENTPLVAMQAYKNHLVICISNNGLSEFKVYLLKNFELQHIIKLNVSTYHAKLHFTTYDADCVRYEYSALNQPKTFCEWNFLTGKTSTIKQVNIPNFSSDDYEVSYELVSVPNVYFNENVQGNNPYLKGEVKVPISIIYKKSFGDAPKPTLLYGYGSYGIPMTSHFRPHILPLLDRGFAFAIAHIRGGGELGRMWYEAGKMSNKKNTFEDFIECAKYLKSHNYSSDIAISGGSAGGMLIGYCINKNPQLFSAAIANVPFVDVLNTMLDDSLPLTPGEFHEWGNPITNKEVFEYIESYSPYDNIKNQDYPHLFISSGLHDQRVTYWEPLKFIAKLRACRTNPENILLLKMNTNAGHAGASGRFNFIYEIAEEIAFLLTTLNQSSEK